MVVDTDQVLDDEPRTGVEIDGRSSEGDALDLLGHGGDPGSAGALGQLDGEQLGHASPEAVAHDEEGVLGPLLQLGHQRVQGHGDDVPGGLRHPFVGSALVKWNIVAVEIHQNVCHTWNWEHLGTELLPFL